MSYKISLMPRAIDDLQVLPRPVRRFVVGQVAALAAAPTALSRPSTFPYSERCQCCPVAYDYLADRWSMVVLFQYGVGEDVLHVLSVMHSIRDRADADEEDGPAI